MEKKQVIIIGAGGHSKVIADIVIKNNDILLGFLDDYQEKGTEIIKGYKVLGTIEEKIQETQNKSKNMVKITRFNGNCEAIGDTEYIIAIGNNETRKKIAEKYEFKYYTAIHPTARQTIGLNVQIEEGTMIMANVVINSNTKIGKHTIINTGAIIEHDNIIEDYVHISPNSTLGGTVKIEEGTHIGIGATIKNNITITKNVTIGAGAVVVKDIKEVGTYVGVPAKEIK